MGKHGDEVLGEEVDVVEEGGGVERNGNMYVSDPSGKRANIVVDKVVRVRNRLSRERRDRQTDT